jgi:hypothetical protein
VIGKFGAVVVILLAVGGEPLYALAAFFVFALIGWRKSFP